MRGYINRELGYKQIVDINYKSEINKVQDI